MTESESKPGALNLTEWTTSASVLGELDTFARNGEYVVVKIDSERSTSRYTVVVARGRLGTNVFHKDGDNLEDLLRQALDFARATAGAREA